MPKPAGVVPRTEGQKHYLRAMQTHDVCLVIGPAGTGKSFLAVAQAVAGLRSGSYKRIVLTRPAVEAGEKLGFLPGDFQAKVNPYLRPLYDALGDLLDPGVFRRYMEGDLIEVCPLAYMRGRTLNNAYIILDEAQNTTVSQMRMVLTRMGEGSKVVVTGDVTQVDLPQGVPSGLVDAVERLHAVKGITVVELGKADIVRHPVVQGIVEAYERSQHYRPSPEDRGHNPVRGRKRR
ncbi:MAG: PhoH family protein [Planctomycetota bacterium]